MMFKIEWHYPNYKETVRGVCQFTFIAKMSLNVVVSRKYIFKFSLSEKILSVYIYIIIPTDAVYMFVSLKFLYS
jgi:hypothetical protein